MRGKDVSDALGTIRETYINESRPAKKKRRKRPLWIAAVAAVLAVCVALGVTYMRGNPQRISPAPGGLKAFALETPEYPKTAVYPAVEIGDEADKWYECNRARAAFYGSGAGLEDFYFGSAALALSAKKENTLYSPLSAYLALGMLAELTDGNTRAQILHALGAESIEALRTQANGVFNANFFNDGATIVIPSDSVWLDKAVDYKNDTLERLAQNYYAASFRGSFGDKKYDAAVQKWIDAQTGGLLKNESDAAFFSPETVVGLFSTLCFRAKWQDAFSSAATKPGVFHAPAAEQTADFMHNTMEHGFYYYGDGFGAVRMLFKHGCSMTFVLPDEGVSPDALFSYPDGLRFMKLAGNNSAIGEYENAAYVKINLAVPKFDISSTTDLKDAFTALGITDCFDAAVSDFSPLTRKDMAVALTSAKQSARVAVDEEGVTAVAFTELIGAGSAEPPQDEIDFTLDRPFIFILSGFDGDPLFVGTVFSVME